MRGAPQSGFSWLIGRIIDPHVPVDAVWAYSALGTTVNVEEGTVAAFL
jgi:hypothetical protein